MNKSSRSLLLLACIVLAAFALTSCSTLSGSGNTESASTTVSISGNGTIYLKADIVTFSINVNETEQTTA